MGCCWSRPEGPNAPSPGGAESPILAQPDPDAAPAHEPRPQSQPSLPQQRGTRPADRDPPSHTFSSSRASTLLPVQSRRRSRRENQPLDQHINKPLRRHVWTSTDRTWTRAAINRERADFFDTRVTARPEVWQAIHAALQVLWDPVGQGAAGDGTNGLATAESMLHAADITLPTGNLAQGVYDILGNYYPLPEWVVANPENLVEDDTDGETDDLGTSHGEADHEDVKGDLIDDDSDEFDEHEAAKKREEKGKAVVQVQDLIHVRARLSENGRDYTVSVGKTDPVRTLAWRLHEAATLPSSRKIRVAYLGKILKENVPLDAQGWIEGHTVNALVFDR